MSSNLINIMVKKKDDVRKDPINCIKYHKKRLYQDVCNERNDRRKEKGKKKIPVGT